jgi:chaperone modulatory protein CbpM
MRVMQVLQAHVLGESDWIAASEICQLCRLDLQVLLELAALGVVVSRETVPGQWQVPATAVPRLRIASRLMHDLGINVSGAALALELLETQHGLERRIRHLERLVGDY